MIRKILSLLTASLVFQTSIYGLIPSKAQAMSFSFPKLWEKTIDINFSDIYPKPFYQKKVFPIVILISTAVVAGVITYVTAGAGAPVSAPFVSTVASWVGGGGAGSYMAGLSTIGGWFGGNAILGASILNGISIAVTGTMGRWAALSVAQKVGVIASITSCALDGVYFFANPETGKLEYRVRVKIPEDIGSDDTKEIINKLYEIEEQIQDAYKDKNFDRVKILIDRKRHFTKEALTLLKSKIRKGKNWEDFVVLGIVAWNNNKYKLFEEALFKLDDILMKSRKDQDTSPIFIPTVAFLLHPDLYPSFKKANRDLGFFYYLYALKELYEGNLEEVKKNLLNAIMENEYALEPYLLYINILGNTNFYENREEIEMSVKLAEEKFDPDEYSTQYTLVSLYYRLATFYFLNGDYKRAERYYRKAFDELSILQKIFFGKQLKRLVQLGIANSLYAQGKVSEAHKIYNDIIEDIDKDNKEERQMIESQYWGNMK